MHTRLLVLGLVVVLALGCGGSTVAPVSGKVTLDGKPVANVDVTFSPVAASGTIEAGMSATGKTNENGEYTLKATNGKTGAQVGMNRVSIVSLAAQVGEGDQRPPRGGWKLQNKIPAKYNEKSELTFDVKPGTNTADFPLTSK
jgi:hypothetical protein